MSGRVRLQFRETGTIPSVLHAARAESTCLSLFRDSRRAAWVMSQPIIPSHMLHALRVGGDAEAANGSRPRTMRGH